jgi:hypothetical protein
MFEAICLSIRITCKANPAAVVNFEEALFLVFTEILQNDVQGKLAEAVSFYGDSIGVVIKHWLPFVPEPHRAATNNSFNFFNRVYPICLSSDVFTSGNT